MLATIETALLVAGVAGYVLAFALVFRLQRWLRGRGAGWPRLLIGTLARLLALLALLFALSLLGRFSAVRHWPLALRLALSYGTVLALVVAPWAFVWSLHHWRRAAERAAGRGIE